MRVLTAVVASIVIGLAAILMFFPDLMMNRMIQHFGGYGMIFYGVYIAVMLASGILLAIVSDRYKSRN